MGTSLQKPAALLRFVFVLFVLAIAASALAETSLPPAGIQPFTIPFSIDARLPRALRPSLEEAARKLGDSRCQEIFGDFTDLSGKRLDLRLASLNQSVPSYLSLVLFYDGRASRPCADRQVLAWTTPGSRAVYICWDQFASHQRANTGDTANIIIHEALHTLGLVENPPDAREIAAQILTRCGR